MLFRYVMPGIKKWPSSCIAFIRVVTIRGCDAFGCVVNSSVCL